MRYLFYALVGICGIAYYFLAPTAQDTGWLTHRCPAGKKDYQPGHGSGLQRATGGYDLSFTIGEADWYDPTPLGREAKDWLKAGGVSYLHFFRPATYAKNHLSALVGFRMTPDRAFEVCAYVNDLRGGHRSAGNRRIPLGDTVNVSYRLVNTEAVFTIEHAGKTTETVFADFVSERRQVAVGPWHGGSSPAPVATGIHTRLIWTGR